MESINPPAITLHFNSDIFLWKLERSSEGYSKEVGWTRLPRLFLQAMIQDGVPSVHSQSRGWCDRLGSHAGKQPWDSERACN